MTILKNKQESCEEMGLNWEDTKNMPITSRVIQETLRVASILSFTFREAIEDVEYQGQNPKPNLVIIFFTQEFLFFVCLFVNAHIFCVIDFFSSGYLIPKGWKVLPLFRNIHHSPENFKDPEKFDPSRFEVIIE